MVGIILLIIVVSFVLLFSKLGAGREQVAKTESTIADFENIYLSTTITKFPYITEAGITLNELFGVLVCYDRDIENFGFDNNNQLIEINIPVVIQNNLDQLYGRDNWAIELDNRYCINSQNLVEDSCGYLFKEFVVYDFLFPLPCKVELRKGKIIISGDNT
ncbi:hypothetical protein JW930_02755 [Candidatus Woesearchaeota archaeon]|nr:hypothetical protein [Candidatus Woesearchaeota archaeon]